MRKRLIILLFAMLAALGATIPASADKPEDLGPLAGCEENAAR